MDYARKLIHRWDMILHGRMLIAGTRPMRKVRAWNLDRTVPFSLAFSAGYYPILKEWN